jgi:1-acyl-sn-glycerol-3-phosphate acyltransferase
MPQKKKKKKWIRPHHLWVRIIGGAIVYPISRLMYGVKFEKFRNPEKKPHFILYNHQTAFDQFFVAFTYPGVVYYVASEDLFSNGLVSWIIKNFVNPIPIKKSTSDMRAVLNCMQVAREGGSIAIAPEGNRTFSGETGYIKPTIVSLIKALKMPVACMRIEGGYGVHPRWSDVKRKGKMRSYVSRVIDPVEYNAMTDEELLSAINSELYIDETQTNYTYTHKKSAEYLERAIFYCPVCGISEFESNGDVIKCKKCGLSATYGSDLRFRSDSPDFKYSTVKEWYNDQSAYVNSIDPNELADNEICSDTVDLYEVIPYKKKIKFGTRKMTLHGNMIALAGDSELQLFFDDISAIAVLGRNKLNIYVNDKIYQIKSHKRFNAVKYMNLYYRYSNVKKGDPYGEFLGI